MFTLELDHLAVVARTLEEGTTFVEAVLGAEMSSGGKHPAMGTHNRLLSLGHDVYLEVIAVDPDAPRPEHRRWFNLDAYDGAPRLMNWICRTDDIGAALENAPAGSGRQLPQTRGDLSWTMAVPEFGRLPYDDASPALIEWSGGMHPARRLPDHGFRLSRLDVFHPRANDLLADFPALHRLPQVAVREGPEKRLIATISTPEGNRILA
ncbi:VOC family protein [Alphaproteobacteria bacterium GH1-50]|uniref:VOC family protein n=1 Tax=Kangsaoukella pontilimi TaxID=2691042 RepID=A0A7C9NFF1_9RHOB|nr:VOC family protein [Kangsaoukella pontilimi]MXQ08819.1 VOC family protein [Kangsaoukella pontilimi]